MRHRVRLMVYDFSEACQGSLISSGHENSHLLLGAISWRLHCQGVSAVLPMPLEGFLNFTLLTVPKPSCYQSTWCTAQTVTVGLVNYGECTNKTVLCMKSSKP